MARSLFNDMNRLGCLVRRIDSMSLGRREVAIGLALGNWHGFSARPISNCHIEWEHPPFLSEEPRSTEADVPQLHPYYLWRYPSYPWGPWLFSVIYYPSEELARLPPIHDLASFSSNLAWPVGRDQWEKKEAEELREVAFWGPLSNFPICSC